MAATKAEERKALEQIKKIIDGLGEDSYIGTAMEGMIEDAEENIENDSAVSMKSRLDHREKQAYALAKDLTQTRNELKRVQEELASERERRQVYEAQLKETREAAKERYVGLVESQQTAKEQAELIIRLKAKLYDLMTAEN